MINDWVLFSIFIVKTLYRLDSFYINYETAHFGDQLSHKWDIIIYKFISHTQKNLEKNTILGIKLSDISE